MKYGLLYYKETNNIGDDIQSYAASRFLPRIDYFIDREHIEEFVPNRKEYVSVIMNAWYIHDYYNFDISPYINPLCISMFFKKIPYVDGVTIGTDYLTENIKEKFIKYGPVGCRDNHTKKIMDKIGIESYFSGCLTLTLDRLNDSPREDYIVTVGLDKKEIEYIKSKTNRKVIDFKQDVPTGSFKNESWEQRKKRVEKVLDLYGKAHLVITTKLHCSLPCLAINTPVLLLFDTSFPENKDRIGSFLSFLNYVNRNEFMKKNINFENPQKNKEKHLSLRNELLKECNKFIKNSSKKSNANLPEITEYIQYVNHNRESKKYIINHLKKLQKKYVKECEKSEILTKNVKKLEDENLILNSQLNDIRNSKTWKMLEKLRKIKK